MKNNKGITLVALVVTIIILLILAGITVAALTGDNGLIGKTGDAKNATERANEKEELEVAVTRLYDKRGNLNATKVVDGLNKDIKNLNTVTSTEGNFPVKVEYKNGHKYQITKDGDIMISVNAGDTAPDDANAIYSSGDYDAIIPSGFTVSKEEGETSIKNGLVVRDSNQNEWVWIPVSLADLNKMYETCDTNNVLLKENNIPKVVTPYKSKASTDVSSNLTRGNPGNQGANNWREPDILPSDSYDGNPDNRIEAGFVESDGRTAKSLEIMAIELKDSYKEMIDSTKENGGFYVGRYELGIDASNNFQEKPGKVINNLKWYDAYKACKNFSKGNVQSRMIWGCQWDQVCRFIHQYGDKVDLTDSRSYGNYNNSQGAAEENSGINKYNYTTGQLNNAWKTNNIYDLAGNNEEWEQEVFFSYARGVRGRN